MVIVYKISKDTKKDYGWTYVQNGFAVVRQILDASVIMNEQLVVVLLSNWFKRDCNNVAEWGNLSDDEMVQRVGI